jgi:hypothetical protein
MRPDVNSPHGHDVLDPRAEQGRAASTWRKVLYSAFPSEPSESGQTLGSADRAVLLGLFASSAVVLALRAPVAFSKIWADDGSEFLGRAARGISVGSFFTEYRGYLSVIPRVFAALLVQAPVGWWAIGTAIAAIAATAGTACVTFLVARSYIPQRALCALLALSVPLVPAFRTESINSIANQHFVLVFAAFWLFLAPPRNAARTIVRSVAVLLIGLSAPLMFVLIPLPIARIFRYGRRELPLLLATAGALLLQGGAHLFWSSSARGGGVTATANAAAAYGTDVVEPTFGGLHLVTARSYAATFGVVAAIGAVSLGAWYLRRAKTARELHAENVACARVESLIVLSLLLSGLSMVVAVQLGGDSRRYAILPSLFLCTFLAASASLVWTASRKRAGVHSQALAKRRTALAVGLGVSLLVIFGWVRGFSASEYRRSGPAWSASLAAARSTCRAAHRQPKAVLVHIAPVVAGKPAWYIELDCAYLRS